MQDVYSILIELSPVVKRQLVHDLCYGLPAVEWEDEENLNICLHHFEKINTPLLIDLQESLNTVSISSFQTSIKNVQHIHSRSGHGTLYLSIEPEQPLLKLKKEIDKSLKGLNIPLQGKFKPQIILGKYDQLNPNRLKEYLDYHSLYHLSINLEITHFTLASLHVTPKRVIYQKIKEYALTSKLEF